MENKEPQKNPLAIALIKAQAEMENAVMNQTNPFYNDKPYADLASIREATIPILTKHGLGIYHTIIQIPGEVQFDPSTATLKRLSAEQWVVRATLVHGESGMSITSDFPIPSDLFSNPQKVGSTITYGKRYTWGALCGIATEIDDDANATAQTDSPPKPTKKVVAKSVVEPPPPVEPSEPREIIIPDKNGKADWLAFGYLFSDAIKASRTHDETVLWVELNANSLSQMEKEAPKIRERLHVIIAGRYEEFRKESGKS